MSETADQTEAYINEARDVLVNPLIPIFMQYAGGDPYHAHRAAVNTLNSYVFRSHAEMISAAQVIALGMASLHALGTSMTEGVPLALAARFQANATALIKTEQAVREILRDPPPEQRRPQPRPKPAEVAPPPQPEPELQAPAQPHPEQQPSAPQPVPPKAEPTAGLDPEDFAALNAFVQGKTDQMPTLPFMKPRPPMGLRAAALSTSATDVLTAATPAPPFAANGRGSG